MLSLFDVDTGGTREEQDDEYLQSITEVLGPLPESCLRLWQRRSNVVHLDGTLLQEVVDEGISEPLEDLVRLYRPADMDDRDAASFIDFLRSMLQVEPHRRALTGELLEHQWLSERK